MLDFQRRPTKPARRDDLGATKTSASGAMRFARRIVTVVVLLLATLLVATAPGSADERSRCRTTARR
jgi:hypothetical protein